jgi:hypothetical protein
MNAKVGREGIFKPTVWNESLHEIYIHKRVRVVNFATSKNPVVMNIMFLHHKCT